MSKAVSDTFTNDLYSDCYHVLTLPDGGQLYASGHHRYVSLNGVLDHLAGAAVALCYCEVDLNRPKFL